jgi:hypothetical protein
MSFDNRIAINGVMYTVADTALESIQQIINVNIAAGRAALLVGETLDNVQEDQRPRDQVYDIITKNFEEEIHQILNVAERVDVSIEGVMSLTVYVQWDHGRNAFVPYEHEVAYYNCPFDWVNNAIDSEVCNVATFDMIEDMRSESSEVDTLFDEKIAALNDLYVESLFTDIMTHLEGIELEGSTYGEKVDFVRGILYDAIANMAISGEF